MDRSWIHSSRASPEYRNGVIGFIKFAEDHGATCNEKLKCPCPKCCNVLYQTSRVAYEHMICNGFDPTYKVWYHHGEDRVRLRSSQPKFAYGGDDLHKKGDEARVMLSEIFGAQTEGDTSVSSLHKAPADTQNRENCKFEKLLNVADQELYNGCKRHTKLSFIIRLFHLKCLGGLSNKIFSLLLVLLREAFPDDTNLPDNFSQTKKIITDLGLSYSKIDACPNDCMLYWKDSAHKESCDICGTSRWKSLDGQSKQKGKKKAVKVLRHFPLKPRLQRMYMSSKMADDMRWHAEGRKKDEKLRHPADSPAWEALDVHPQFGSELRNVRLGLATDGFNPFRSMSITHSIWPVVLIPYNLPPWLCMKQPNMMLSLLIPGPLGPGNDIDVYLRPLVEELKELWASGVETYDISRKESFTLRAALLWTISDFPGYAMLSGWSTKGRFACPSCHKDTCSRYLRNGRKHCYMGHRRFLPLNHGFRKQKQSFDGTVEMREPPSSLAGFEILDQLRGTSHIFGKRTGKKRPKNSNPCSMPYNWKKKSIFFELPYWEDNLLKHNLDVMHIEKNVCDSVLGTLLNIEGKSKDTLKSRLDLVDMGVRHALHPMELPDRKKLCLPAACFSMDKREQELFCEVLKSLKVPDGYSSNIGKRVSAKERKVFGLKSHDCHVIMQQLLPLAIRRLLPKNVSSALIELSNFFHEVCSKVCEVEELERLKDRIVQVLCQMERIFPPAFFDIMMHLPVHLVDEVMLGGPVQYRWMYPIERYLFTLKSYVRNRAQPEGSIAEGYIAEECLTFCSRYLPDVESKINRPVRNDDGSAVGSAQPFQISNVEWAQAHRYVLFNDDRLESYRKRHLSILNMCHSRASVHVIQKKHNEEFAKWLKEHVKTLKNSKSHLSEEIVLFAQGPRSIATRMKGYISNGYRFCTIEKERFSKSQNSGVVVKASTTSYSSAKDKRPVTSYISYYGRLTDVIELAYSEHLKYILFKCDWVDVMAQGKGIKTDEFGFTLVNFSRLLYTGEQVMDDPFVLASQAEQVFYVADPIDKDWNVVVKMKPRDLFDMDVDVDKFLDCESYWSQNLHDNDQDDDGVSWAREDVPATTVDAPSDPFMEEQSPLADSIHDEEDSE